MRNTMMFGTIAAAALMLAACNQNTTSNAPPPAQTSTQTASTEPAPGSRNETISAAKDAVAGVVGKTAAELTSSSKGFAEAAAMGDMYEIEASKIAMQRARSKDVKDFAQMMVDAHTKTTAGLKAALAKTHVDAVLPVQFDARHQGLLNDLKGAKAEDFDGRYVSQQEAAHDEALILMRGYAKDGEDPQLKSFAADTEPHVQMHIDMLKTIDEKMKATNKRAENR